MEFKVKHAYHAEGASLALPRTWRFGVIEKLGGLGEFAGLKIGGGSEEGFRWAVGAADEEVDSAGWT